MKYGYSIPAHIDPYEREIIIDCYVVEGEPTSIDYPGSAPSIEVDSIVYEDTGKPVPYELTNDQRTQDNQLWLQEILDEILASF